MKQTCVKLFVALLMFALPAAAFAQNTFKVTGKVYDAETNEPIIGAGVMMKASNIGTITDLDGNYEITVNDTKGVLIVSAIGYEPMEMAIGKKAVINFPLEADVESLEDAVVVGYGTQKKATITGSLTTANMTDIARSTAPTLSNSLGGVIPGIISRQSSGEPGNDTAILQIRGMGTWVNSSPLVLVDGIERSLNYVNTEEIESFSVLKDASATAVYGMRGANGVILITTKKGKAGKAKVTFRTEATNLHGLRFPEYIQGHEFANLMNEASTVSGNPLPWTDEQIEKFRDGSDPYLYPNVDWTDEVLKKDAFQTTNTLSVTGGNETVRYYAPYIVQGHLIRSCAVSKVSHQTDHFFVGSMTCDNLTAGLGYEDGQFVFRACVKDADVTEGDGVEFFLDLTGKGSSAPYKGVFKVYVDHTGCKVKVFEGHKGAWKPRPSSSVSVQSIRGSDGYSLTVVFRERTFRAINADIRASVLHINDASDGTSYMEPLVHSDPDIPSTWLAMYIL